MNEDQNTILEVCIASLDDAVAAKSGGADRLELNVALELGGLTPSIGLLTEVKLATTLPVVAMVRPRPGGFCYSDLEKKTMLRDVEHLLEAGADGIAVGALRTDRQLDHPFLIELRRHLQGQDFVINRAFDVTSLESDSLARLVELGVTRVLTSGGCKSAFEGRERISKWVSAAAGAIEILPGSGISPGNVVELLKVTGCRQVHGSFSRIHEDDAEPVASSTYRKTDIELVRQARAALDRRASPAG